MNGLNLPRLHRNPFGGLTDDQLPGIVQPRDFMDEVRTVIERGERQAIQFIGRQGRGKTTHLRLLAGAFQEGSLHLLPRHSSANILLADPARVLFIDSIHNLSFRERRTLFRRSATIIFTTHLTRRPECWSVGMPLRSYQFKGLDTEVLTAIIRARTQDAMVDPKEQWEVDPGVVRELIRKFGDDYRGILNYLYQNTDLPA